LWIVHRLDKETSGVLLLARTAEAHRALNTQFEQHQVTKIYHALAMGEPAWEQTMAELPLRPNGDRRHRTVVDLRHGKPALTHLRILQRFPGCALLEARPETGRTHQIRAHLAALGFPLAGDALYGTRIDREGTLRLLPRPALHAWSLMLIHPGNRNLLTCTAPYPADFSSLLEALQKIG
jgi:RluA family pseudouridine synthase